MYNCGEILDLHSMCAFMYSDLLFLRVYVCAVHAPGDSPHQEPGQATEERRTHRESSNFSSTWNNSCKGRSVTPAGFDPGPDTRAGATGQGS